MSMHYGSTCDLELLDTVLHSVINGGADLAPRSIQHMMSLPQGELDVYA